MLWMHSPPQVKTLRQFSADDPWNGMQRASFRVEAAWGGFAPAYAVAEDSMPRQYAIVSNASGKRHRLPDVLAGLWLGGKLPAESLPALLNALEPSLNRFDYIAHLSLTPFQQRFRLWVGPVVGLLVMVLTVSITMLEPQVRLQGLTNKILTDGFLAAAVLGGIPGLPMWLLDRRRRRQMERVLQLPVGSIA